MSSAKIEHGALLPIYADVGNSYGFYRIKPGKAPYICLNNCLLEGQEAIHLTVYRTLLDFHNSIPDDSWIRAFPMVRYFEELIEVPAKEQSPELIIIGRAKRRVWHCTSCGEPVTAYRLIGEAG